MKRIAWIIAGGLVASGAAGLAFAQSGAGVSAEAAKAEGPAQSQPPPQGHSPYVAPITMGSRPQATGGEALYVEKCIMCHGPGGMGTGLLGRTRKVALLEDRDNLPAAFVITAARQGIGNMPPIPRGEASDEQLKAIADYLAAGPHPQANGAPPQ